MLEIKWANVKKWERICLFRHIDRTCEDSAYLSHIKPAVDQPKADNIYVAGIGDIPQDPFIAIESSPERAAKELHSRLSRFVRIAYGTDAWQLTLREGTSRHEGPWIIRVPVRSYADHLCDRYGAECAALFIQFMKTGRGESSSSSFTGWKIHEIIEKKSLEVKKK